jgi:hypothetical protein
MKINLLFAGACLLLPGAVLAQETAAMPPGTPPVASTDAAASPGTVGSNTTLTLGGKLDLHLVGKPTLTTPDGVVYQLVGEQATTIEQLKQIDDKTIVVAGQVVQDGTNPTLNLSILSFWVVGSTSAIGSMPVGETGEAATVTPILTARGMLGTKLVGKPDLTTADGKIYTLIGPQVATIEELKDLNKGQLEVNGQLINNDGRMDIVVLSFRLLDTPGGPNGTGAIGTPSEGADGAAMAPSVTLEGVLNTSLISQPDLQVKDGKSYRLIGPEVSVIAVTKDIDGKNVSVTGQLMTNGEFENLVVSSFQVLEPQPAAPVVEPPAPGVVPQAEVPPVTAPADPQDAPPATPKL